nr:hypothetical protein [Hubei arthropod virus 3]
MTYSKFSNSLLSDFDLFTRPILQEFGHLSHSMNSLSTAQIERFYTLLRRFIFNTPQVNFAQYLDPITTCLSGFFSRNGLALASDIARWASFLLNIITSIVTLAMTTSTTLKALTITCLISCTTAIILEIVTSRVNARRAQELMSRVSTEVVNGFSAEIINEILSMGRPAIAISDEITPEMAVTGTLALGQKFQFRDETRPQNIRTVAGMMWDADFKGTPTEYTPLERTENGLEPIDIDNPPPTLGDGYIRLGGKIQKWRPPTIASDITSSSELAAETFPAAHRPGYFDEISAPGNLEDIPLTRSKLYRSTSLGNIPPHLLPLPESRSDSGVSSSTKPSSSIPTLESSFTPVSSFNPNNTFEGAVWERQKSATQWYKICKRILCFVVCATGLIITKGDLSKMNYFITLHRFKKAISEEFDNASEVVDWFCNEICGLEFHEEKDAIEALQTKIKQADEYLLMQATEFGVDPVKFIKMQAFVKTVSKIITDSGSIKDPTIKNLSTILQTRSVALHHKISEVWPVVEGSKIRQCPVPLLVRGEPGVGKTTLITNVIIPKLAKLLDLSPSTYMVKFTDSDKYWSEYGGQSFAVCDEAFDKASDLQDNMVTALNSVISAGAYNMQGAFIKYQPCCFKFIFIICNSKTCPKLAKMLSPDATRAFWDRLNFPIQVSVKPQYHSPIRGQHKFQDDWSHIQLHEQTFTFNAQSSGDWVINGAGRQVSLDGLLKRLVTSYNKEAATFKKSLDTIAANCPATPQGEVTDLSNFVVNIAGRSGVGKSFAVRELVTNFSRYLKRGIQFHEGKLNGIVDPKKIQVCNDMLPFNEEHFNHVYDTCKGQLIFVTHNFPYNPRRTHIPVLGYQYSWEYGVFMTYKMPATARRAGVPGVHVTPFGKVSTPNSEAIYAEMHDRGFFQVSGSTTMQTGTFQQHVWAHFLKYLSSHQEISIIDGQMPPTPPEIDIKFESISKLKEVLSSEARTAMLLIRPQVDNYINIPNRDAIFGDVSIDPKVFKVPSEIDSFSEREILLLMIRNLRHIGVDVPVRVQVGHACYFAHYNTIIKNTQTMTHSISFDQSNLILYSHYDGTVESILTLPIETAAHGFAYGFKCSTPALLDILFSFKKEILEHEQSRLYLAEQHKKEIRIQAAREVLSKKPSYMALLRQHPLFVPACCCFAALGTAAVASVIVYIYKQFKSPETPINITAEVSTEGIKWEDSEYDYFKEKHPELNEEVLLALRKLRERYGRTAYEELPADELAFAQQATFQPQSWTEQETRAFEEKAKRLKATDEEIRAIRSNRESYGVGASPIISAHELENVRKVLGTFVPNAIQTMLPTHSSSYLLRKLEEATVVVSTFDGVRQLNCYGICIKGNFILTVAHIGVDGLSVTCDFLGAPKTFDAISYSIIGERDLQILQIVDKTFPPGADIIKHFIADDKPQTMECNFMVVAKPNVVMPCEIIPNNFQRSMWGFTTGAFVASFHSIKTEVVFEGYCGYAYLTKDKIVGIHVGARANRRGLLTLASQNILKAMLEEKPQASKPLSEEWYLRTFARPDGTPISSVFPLPCSYYDKWESVISKHAFEPTDGIYVLGKTHFQSPFPRREKFFSTGLAEIPSFPCAVANAPMKPVKGTVCDVVGRPSIALTQITKFGGFSVVPDESALALATTDLGNLLSLTIGEEYDTPYPSPSLDQVLNGYEIGHPLRDFVEPIALSTGAGFYWKNKFKISVKRDFFNQIPDEKFVTKIVFKDTKAAEHLRENYMMALYATLQHVRPLFVNSDAMKAELLPLEKVKAGSTRLFSVADIVEIMLERKFFLPHMALLNKYHEQLPFKLGIHPQREFHWIYQEMKHLEGPIYSIDFARYDKSHNFHFVFAALNTLLRDPPMAKIFSEIVCRGVHHIFDFVYIREKGQNSGSAITTLLNMLMTYLLVSYAFILHYYRTNKKYPKHPVSYYIWMCIYSDDLLYSERQAGVFPIEAFVSIMDELKLQVKYHASGPEGAEFLSRNFYCELGTVYPQLKHSSFTRHLYFTTLTTSDHRAAMYSLFLDEASFYSRDYFNKACALVFAILEKQGDSMTLSLIDWRSWNMRREIHRRLVYNNERYTLAPLSVGDAFTTFPSVEKFSKIVKHRYTKAVEIVSTNENIEFSEQQVSNELYIPITALSYRSQLQNSNNLAKVRLTAHNQAQPQMSQPANVQVAQHDNLSDVRAVTSPVAATAKATVSDYTSNVSNIPVAPIPPVAITNADDDSAPLVIGNSDAAPSLLTAGGVSSNLLLQAYRTWTRVGQYTIASDAAAGTSIFTLPWSPSTLPGAPGLWCSMHERCTGSIEFAVENIGSEALTGTSKVGWLPDVEAFTTEDFERVGKWLNMPMNKSSVGHFIVPDVRKDGYWRNTSEVASHGIVAVIDVPLTNPFGVTGATVTLNVYCRLGADFELALWQQPVSPTALQLLPSTTFSGLQLDGLRFLLDGNEAGKTFQGSLPPFSSQEFLYLDGNVPGSNHLYNHNTCGVYFTGDMSTVNTVLVSTTTLPSITPAEDVLPPINYRSASDFIMTPTPKITLRMADSSKIVTEPFPITDFSIQWDNQDIVAAGYTIIDATESTTADSDLITWDTAALGALDLDLVLTTWPYSVSNPLPNDYVKIAFSTYTVPLDLATVDTALGRAVVPPSSKYLLFTNFIKSFAGDGTVEFDIVSRYGSAALLTCRFSADLGFYARFVTFTPTRSYYASSTLDDCAVVNLRKVEDGTVFRQSPETGLIPRFSSLAQSLRSRHLNPQRQSRVTLDFMNRERKMPKFLPSETGHIRPSKAEQFDDYIPFIRPNDKCYLIKSNVEHYSKREVLDLFPVSHKFMQKMRNRSPGMIIVELAEYDLLYYTYPTRVLIARLRRENGMQPRHQASAAIIGMSMAGAALSTGAQTAGGMFGKKKDREFAKEMQDDRQAWATEAGKAGMDFQREMWNKNTAADAVRIKGQYEHEFEMHNRSAFHQNRMQRSGFRQQSKMQANQFQNSQQMQSNAFEQQTAMQQADFAHQDAMAQAKLNAAATAFGVTNPAMQSSASTQTPGTSTGTQTYDTGTQPPQRSSSFSGGLPPSTLASIRAGTRTLPFAPPPSTSSKSVGTSMNPLSSMRSVGTSMDSDWATSWPSPMEAFGSSQSRSSYRAARPGPYVAMPK